MFNYYHHILPTLLSRWLILCTDEAMTSTQEQSFQQASGDPVIVWNIHKDLCKTIVCLDSYHLNRSCCRLFSLPYIWIVCQWRCLVTIKQAPFLYYRGDKKWFHEFLVYFLIFHIMGHVAYLSKCPVAKSRKAPDSMPEWLDPCNNFSPCRLQAILSRWRKERQIIRKWFPGFWHFSLCKYI